jgi:hypothetical protein
MTVTTKALQSRGYVLGDTEVLPSGRRGYHHELMWPEEHSLPCYWCAERPENDHDPRIIHSGVFELCLCPHCAERLISSLIQDLARVVEKEGFVVGTWLAYREAQITKDIEDILFSGRVQRLPGDT